MLEGFFQYDDMSQSSNDVYQDRLKLRLEGIPDTIPRRGAINVRAIVTLDDQPFPVLPFPRDDSGEPNPTDHLEYGTAIGAAAVFEDVPEDVDDISSLLLTPVDPGTLGGSDAASTFEVRTLIVKMVIQALVRKEDIRAGFPIGTYRTALKVFQVVEEQAFQGRGDTWLVEWLGPFGRNHISARVRRLEPGGQAAQADNLNLPGILRMPTNYFIDRHGVTLDYSGGQLFVLHANDALKEDKELAVVAPNGNTTRRAPPVNPVRAIAYYPDDDIIWFAGERDLVLANAGDLSPIRTVSGRRANGLAIDRASGDVWAALNTLLRFGRDGNDLEVPTLRALTPVPPRQNRQMLLHSTNDGGVICLANYRRFPRLVRVNRDGEVLAFSADDVHLSRTIEMGVSRATGRAAAIHIESGGAHPVLSLFDPALVRVRRFAHTDAVFANAFDRLLSVDISAPPDGEKAWVSGWKVGRDPVTGRPINLGAVGFLDEDEQFTLVQSGMKEQTMVRAF